MRYSYEQFKYLNNNIVENKEKLNKAFKALRKYDLVARQNFRCCQSCAAYEIATDVEKMLDNGKTVHGWVFYHRQDYDSAFVGNRRYPANGELYLAYTGGSTSKYEKNGLPTVEIGKMVAQALTEAGLVYEWDGSEDQRILVKLGEKAVEKIEAEAESWGE